MQIKITQTSNAHIPSEAAAYRLLGLLAQSYVLMSILRYKSKPPILCQKYNMEVLDVAKAVLYPNYKWLCTASASLLVDILVSEVWENYPKLDTKIY